MTFSQTALAGRTALITGGGSGIGFGIARGGARVVIASRNAERLEAAAGAIRAEGDAVHTAVVDVREDGALQAVVDMAVARFGGPDIMVANAAIYLCSEAGDFVNGSDVGVDGGRQRV